MERILRETIEEYLIEKQNPFTGNYLGQRLRHDFPIILAGIIQDNERYKVQGSVGKGKWTDNPWIAILDTLITETPQAGYYPVFLFKKDMSGVYLSLNQGVTEVNENYRSETKNILRLRAQDYRAKLDYEDNDLVEIDLNSTTTNARLYVAGNIIAKYYPANNLPTSDALIEDVLQYMHYYEELTYNNTHVDENINLTATEKKQYRLHFRIERNASISARVKRQKGYTCEACGFGFETRYGALGRGFIEAHHLTPISDLVVGQYQLNIANDFAVLCSNCHSMIHKLDDCSNIEELRRIIQL